MAQTIDLAEIQAKIDQRSVEWTQPSRGQLQQGLLRERMESLWRMMTALYGHKWVSAYGEEVDKHRVWAAALHDVTEDQVRLGLRSCVDQHLDWPPSAPEFRGLCLAQQGDWERRQIEAADAEWRSRALPPPRDEAHAKREISKMREALGIRKPAP